MSSDELSLFSYEILGLVGSTGAGPHDLRQMVRRGRMLDWAGESQYYVEPKRLAALGYLEARKEPGKTRERTVYTLTDKGLRGAARMGAHAGPLHAAQERAAAAPADRRPRRRGADAREHRHAARGHRGPAHAARRDRGGPRTGCPTGASTCCSSRRSCAGCSTSTSSSSRRSSASSPTAAVRRHRPAAVERGAQRRYRAPVNEERSASCRPPSGFRAQGAPPRDVGVRRLPVHGRDVPPAPRAAARRGVRHRLGDARPGRRRRHRQRLDPRRPARRERHGQRPHARAARRRPPPRARRRASSSSGSRPTPSTCPSTTGPSTSSCPRSARCSRPTTATSPTSSSACAVRAARSAC